jgi:uncharacterized GH25 family protein
MYIMRTTVAVTILIIGLTYSGLSRAHDFYVEPSALQIKPKGSIELSIVQVNDEQSETLPFYDDFSARLDLTSPDGVAAINAEAGDDPIATIRPATPGYHIVTFVTQPRTAELSTEKFKKYVQGKGLEAAIKNAALRPDEVPETYTRHSKVILAVGENLTGTDYLKPTGLKLELIPGRELPSWKPNSPITLNLLYKGKPLSNALVQLFSPGRWKNRIKATTDSNGKIVIQVPHGGMWVAGAVHLIPSSGGEHDWQSFWASLTFAVNK